MSAFKETEVTSISFGELYELVEQIASGLFKRGIGKGDYILLYANNRPEWIIACLAIIRVGAIVVPIDIQCDEEALNAILNNIHPKVIFTVQENLSRLKNMTMFCRIKCFCSMLQRVNYPGKSVVQ